MATLASIFLSHSSADRPFARRLAGDLRQEGHAVWFDEWVVGVGDPILHHVDRGLERAQLLLLVLSRSSAQSLFVRAEWLAKLWDEVTTGVPTVLPALIEDVRLPPLLRGRQVADFRHDYASGFERLASTLSALPSRPVLPAGGLPIEPAHREETMARPLALEHQAATHADASSGRVAWRLFVQIATRVATRPLAEGAGLSCREALRAMQQEVRPFAAELGRLAGFPDPERYLAGPASD